MRPWIAVLIAIGLCALLLFLAKRPEPRAQPARTGVWSSTVDAARGEDPDPGYGPPATVLLDAPATEAIVALRAVDERGAPVVGVRGVLRVLGSRSAAEDRILSTDGAGLAELRFPPGRAYLDLDHPEYASVPRREFELAAGERLEIEIVMPEPRWITGIVRDRETGHPLPGARIVVGGSAAVSAIADGRGVYRAPFFDRIGESELIAEADGYRAERAAIPAEEGSPVDFELARGTIVRGRVVDPGGRPIEGADLIVISTEVGRSNPDRSARRSISEISDPDGRFRFDGIRLVSPHWLTVHARGFGSALLAIERAENGPSDIIDLGEIPLLDGRTIAGRVLDVGGAPLPGRRVRLSAEDPDGRWRGARFELPGTSRGAVTDEAGGFRFSDLAPGSFRIQVGEAGRPNSERFVRILDSDPDVISIELVEARGSPFRVEVRDEEGEPLSGVTVFVESPEPSGLWSGQKTDPEGIAAFEGFAGPVQVRIHEPPGHAPVEPLRILPAGQTEVVVIARGPVIRGRVLAPEGVDPGAQRLEVRFRSPEGREGTRFVRTAPDGAFDTAVPDGSVVDIDCNAARFDEMEEELWVQTFLPWRGSIRGVRAPAADLLLVLEPVAAERGLDVRVSGPAGEPIAGVAVRAWLPPGGGQAGTALTDEAGVAPLTGLPALPLRVVCTAPEDPPATGGDAWLVPAPLELTAEGQEVAIELSPGWRVRGSVVDADGTSPGMVAARLETSTGRRRAFHVMRGHFEFVLLDGETATVDFEVERSDGRYAARATGIAAGEAEREIILRRE